ncbi:MAG: hemolysin III family protein [Cyclobacteriaceae bacterium]
MTKKEKRKAQSNLEEWFNMLSHGLAALAAIAGLVILIILGVRSEQSLSLFSALFYGISLVILFTMSALYHGLRHKTAKAIFNRFDHISIFLLIAGTYTPVLLLVLGGTAGWVLFGLQWGIALTGAVLKIFYTGKYESASLVLYAVMGWMIIFRISELRAVFPEGGFWLLVAGGMAYTFGIIFYVIDTRMKLSHFIWHLFVIAGSLLHYLMMILYVY